jgi:hypothetical protein
MSKRSPPKEKLYRWRISRIRGTPAVEIGTVEAPGRGQRDQGSDQILRHHQSRASRAVGGAAGEVTAPGHHAKLSIISPAM